jgi:hypothetical protein
MVVLHLFKVDSSWCERLQSREKLLSQKLCGILARLHHNGDVGALRKQPG